MLVCMCVHLIFVVNISLIFSYSYAICMLNFKLKNLYIFRASLDEVLKPPCHPVSQASSINLCKRATGFVQQAVNPWK